MAALSGNTGSVTGGVSAVLNTWSATISRAVSDVTGFGNGGRHRIMGVYDMTGSAGGIMDDSANFVATNEPAAMTAITGANITLIARATKNSIQAPVVIDSLTLGSTKTGDAVLSFNFSLAAGTSTSSPFTIVWGP